MYLPIVFFEIVSRYSGYYLYGFSLFYVFLLLTNNIQNNKLIASAYGLIPVAGVIFFLSETLYYSFNFLINYFDGVAIYAFKISPYTNIYTLIIFPIFFKFLPSQLFWFKWVKKNKWGVLSLIPFFVFSFDRMYIMLTSFQRDYLPSSWSFSRIDYFLEIFLSLLSFYIITFLYLKVKRQNLNY